MGQFEWTKSERFEPKNRIDQDAEIEITSMVDLTFLLLVFFMVATTFTSAYAFESAVVDTEPGCRTDSIELTEIRINADNDVALVTTSGHELLDSPAELNAMIRKSLQDTEGRLLVSAHPDSTYQTSIRIMDIGSSAGATSIQTRTLESVEF